MPNGGLHHCARCHHFDSDSSRCSLRKVDIINPRWTTCNNWHRDGVDIKGPLYAIVGEVRNRAVRYSTLPYFHGNRVESVQSGGGDSVLHVCNPEGESLEFPDGESYLLFIESH